MPRSHSMSISSRRRARCRQRRRRRAVVATPTSFLLTVAILLSIHSSCHGSLAVIPSPFKWNAQDQQTQQEQNQQQHESYQQQQLQPQPQHHRRAIDEDLLEGALTEAEKQELEDGSAKLEYDAGTGKFVLVEEEEEEDNVENIVFEEGTDAAAAPEEAATSGGDDNNSAPSQVVHEKEVMEWNPIVGAYEIEDEIVEGGDDGGDGDGGDALPLSSLANNDVVTPSQQQSKASPPASAPTAVEENVPVFEEMYDGEHEVYKFSEVEEEDNVEKEKDGDNDVVTPSQSKASPPALAPAAVEENVPVFEEMYDGEHEVYKFSELEEEDDVEKEERGEEDYFEHADNEETEEIIEAAEAEIMEEEKEKEEAAEDQNNELVDSDGAQTKEVEVDEMAKELLIEAEEEEEDMEAEYEEEAEVEAEMMEEEEEKKKGRGKKDKDNKIDDEEDSSSQSFTTAAASTASVESASSTTTTTTSQSQSNKSAWIAHGTIGTIIFGLLVPLSISSAFFRDCMPAMWIYIHVCINVVVFAMTFFAVGIAFATMSGTGNAHEGHMKEVHHVSGLMLLLVVSFQTANGFLRPPREFLTDDEHDATPGAILRGSMAEKSMTARTLWYLVHGASGLFVFAMGTYQVRSGLGLFAKRYGVPDWGPVYVGYIGWLAAVLLIGKVWMKWRERKMKLNNMEIQMGRGNNGRGGRNGSGGIYDPENDLTVAQFETV
eukprot:CAMPEP_0183715208 /NCGR_PEP_ID=MMETSP0737-20130205/9535_1 /TAXON_ID=385413 /ORGANISM="Thalassiosira miniscula, Strain CCMP1093" /LENGTH=714 /DNA_ID=CAMNT_0025944297 /DNA_START=141 /DNA_END=2285 /DNA_ORIENTATION=-